MPFSLTSGLGHCWREDTALDGLATLIKYLAPFTCGMDHPRPLSEVMSALNPH